MAAPVVSEVPVVEKKSSECIDSFSKEEPLPIRKPVKQWKHVHNIFNTVDHVDNADINVDVREKMERNINIHNREMVERTENIDVKSDKGSDNLTEIIHDIDGEIGIQNQETELAQKFNLRTEMDVDVAIISNTVPMNAPGHATEINDVCALASQLRTLPVMSEILDDSLSNNKDKDCNSTIIRDIFKITMPPMLPERLSKPLYKGVMVPCGQLKDYLDSLATFNRKCMLRKGREVHKIYVDMTKGETFLDDQFHYTEFGKMVLSNGSIRAGRAKNAKQIVVARETLYCSGITACKRACGGYGICLTACDKTKMRGHKCSYRIKLTQRLGFVNFWFVEELGSHDQLNGKDCDFKANSQIAQVASKVSAALDLANGLKMKIYTSNIPTVFKKKTKVKTLPSLERHQVDGVTSDYHYVLGVMPSGSPGTVSANQESRHSFDLKVQNISNISPCRVQQHAINMYNEFTAQAMAASIAPMSSDACSGQLNAVKPGTQMNLINYMSDITNSGIGTIGNPLVVGVKHKPQSTSSTQLVYNPLVTALSQVKNCHSPIISSPYPITKDHSSSLSRVHSQSERFREKSPVSSMQKILEIEKRIKQESKNNCQMQAQKEVLEQIHDRIKKRAKYHKSGHTWKVLPKDTSTLDKDDKSVIHLRNITSDIDVQQSSVNTNIPQQFSSTNTSLNDANLISSLALHRLQVLNQVLQNETFQAATSQFEKMKADLMDNCLVQQDKALNLSVKKANCDTKAEPDQERHFKLAEELKKEDHLTSGWKKDGELSDIWKNDCWNLFGERPVEWKNGCWNLFGELPVEWKKNGHLNGSWKNGEIPEAWKKEKLSESCIQREQDIGEGRHSELHLVNKHLQNGLWDVPDLKNRTGTEAAVDKHELTKNEKELVCRVKQLESHVKQLQNIVIKREVSTTPPVTGRRHRKAQRKFDFTKYNTRHIALKVMYIGTGYTGFAGLEATDNTIEKVLFEGLRKTQLIENKEAACYTKCGRTDKGVSAFGQVVALDVRTNLTCGVGVRIREGGTAHQRPGDKNTEIPYCHMLNKVLPPEVRVLAWAPVDTEFSARFTCKKRTYKYFFPQGNLNTEVMHEAAQRLIGEHDFRNFCKINDGVNNFIRHVYSAEVKITNQKEGGYSMCEFTITATAYLWHQIRCIMTVLILIGQGREKPQVIDELMDIDKNPRRPQYNIAADFPLCLYEGDYGDDLEWIFEPEWHEDNIKSLQQLWAENSIKASMLKKMLDDLNQTKVETECDIAPWSDLSPPVLHQAEVLMPGTKYKVYKPIMERPTCESVQYKLEQNAKRRKLNTGADNMCLDEEGGE